MLQWPPSLWWNWTLYQMLPSSSSSVAYSSSLSHCPTTTIWDAGPRRSESPASSVLTHLVLGELSDGPLGWSFHQKRWTTTSTCSPGVESYRKAYANPKGFILIPAYTQHRGLPLVWATPSLSVCFFLLLGKHSQYGPMNRFFLFQLVQSQCSPPHSPFIV